MEAKRRARRSGTAATAEAKKNHLNAMKDRALTFERTHIGATSLQYSIKAKECGEHYGTVERSLLHCPPDNNYKDPSQ